MIPELPADVEYLPCGTIWVAADEEEMGEVRRKKLLYDGLGIRSEVLDSESLARPSRTCARRWPAACWFRTTPPSTRPAPRATSSKNRARC